MTTLLLAEHDNKTLKDSTNKALTAGKGVDVVFDPVGAELFEPAVRATGWNGRVLVIGFAVSVVQEGLVRVAEHGPR